MAKCILEAKDIRLSFGDRQVLSVDRLAVFDDERVGLIGENGMGKTTLLRVLAGELVPDEGTVRRAQPTAMIRQMGETSGETAEDAEIAALFQSQESREGLSGGGAFRRFSSWPAASTAISP